ncbi:MAG: hypothetical protein ACI89E_001942 [Planctomycetota bacterium]
MSAVPRRISIPLHHDGAIAIGDTNRLAER